MYLKHDQQIHFILQTKSNIEGASLFPRWKMLDSLFTVKFSRYHIRFTIKEFQYTFFTFPSKECMVSLIKKHE